MEKLRPENLRNARIGAARILEQCLSLENDEELTIFWDESCPDVADILDHEAQHLGHKCTMCHVPLEEQRRHKSGAELDQKYRNLLENSRCILTCLAGDVEATAFRQELLSCGVDVDRRVGHIPGASIEALIYSAFDHQQYARRCEEVALALALGNDAQLLTYQFNDKGHIVDEHVIYLNLAGLDRPPVVSTGIIPLGTWGNIPGAEAFIAPWEGTAHGTYVLNGSFLDTVLAVDEVIFLHFEAGKLGQITGAPHIKHSLMNLFKNGGAEINTTHTALAELGIGLNPAINHLTGQSLIDEKCAGTAHIAIGDSIRFGGRTDSPIHEDLITRSPTLVIDNKDVLRNGKYVLNVQEWTKRLSEISLQEQIRHNTFRVGRTELSVEVGPPLKVRREVGAGRVGQYAITALEDDALVSQIYQTIPFFPDTVTYSEIGALMSKLGYAAPSSDLLRAGLQLLVNHRVLRVVTS